MDMINIIKLVTVVPTNERIHHIDVNTVNIKYIYIFSTNNQIIKSEHNENMCIRIKL